MNFDEHFVILGETMRRHEERLAHVILSEAGVIQTWQPVMVALFGWEASEAIGSPLSELIVPPEMREAHQAGLARWCETTVTAVACKHFRTCGLAKDGSCIEVYVDVQIVRDDAGVRFLGWLAPVSEDACGTGTP